MFLSSSLALVGSMLLAALAAVAVIVGIRGTMQPAPSPQTQGEDTPTIPTPGDSSAASSPPADSGSRLCGRITSLSLIAALVALVVAGISVARAVADNGDSVESRLLATIAQEKAANPATLAQLALLRQDTGRLAEAADTWGVVLKRFGSDRLHQDRDAQTPWGDLSRFYLKRLQRLQSMQAHTPDPAQVQATNDSRQARLEPALQRTLAELGGKGLVARYVIDLDGDGLWEVFGATRLPDSPYTTVFVLKWNSTVKDYRLQWQGLGGCWQYTVQGSAWGPAEIVALDGQREVGRILANGHEVRWIELKSPPVSLVGHLAELWPALS
jgi:hypothetical protein